VWFVVILQVGTSSARLPPYTLHIPMCSASHVPLHVTGSSQQQQSVAAARGWPFAPCHAAAAVGPHAHHHHHHHHHHPLTLQPCGCAAAAPHFLAAAAASPFYHAGALPPPPAYHQLPPRQHPAPAAAASLYPAAARHDVHPGVYHRQPSSHRPAHQHLVSSSAAAAAVFSAGLPVSGLVPAVPPTLQQVRLFSQKVL